MSNTKLNNAVKETFGGSMHNAKTEINKGFENFANALAKGGSAVENCAVLCNNYFTKFFNCPRWFDTTVIEDNKEVQAEKKLLREMLNNALISKGVNPDGLRMYWKRVQDKAFELAYPKEAEAKKQAKKQADADKKASKADKGEGESTTADISPEMMEYAQLLAGSCDWDKSLANRVLAMVFAEATKA